MTRKKQMVLLAVCATVSIFSLLVGFYLENPFKSTQSMASMKRPMPMQEDTNIYRDDDGSSVVDFYITVMKDDSQSSQYTLKDINDDWNSKDEEKPTVKVIFQEGTSEGPQKDNYGYNVYEANGVMTARGQSSRGLKQQSYAVKLDSSASLWRGQLKINLNKHMGDATRIRNKLSFDYFKSIPDFSSLRTQFVHLHIKDLTKDIPDSEFTDYGLYTQVEEPNKKFLKSHGLDPNGNLYKAKEYLFLNDENIKDVTDKGYNKKLFEEKLEIVGKEDHKKLLDMMKDVNDPSKDINQVIEKHFNRENYLTWLAVNILMDNIDTFEQNFLLYSPSGTNIWYFLPWDYDGAWGYYEQANVKENKGRAQWMGGISTYWTSLLHQRFLQKPENIKELTLKIESLHKIINRENTQKLLKNYYNIVKTFVSAPPDKNYLPVSFEDFEKEYGRLADVPEVSLKRYYENIQAPMPFQLYEPALEGNRYAFNWEPSFDLEDEPVYRFQVATDPDFTDILVDEDDLTDTTYTMDKPDAGMYYWKVTAHDGEGHEQIALGYFEDEDISEKTYYGVKAWEVK